MNQVATIAEENEWSTVRLKTLLMSAKNGVWGAEPRGDGSDTLCIRVADFDRDKLTVIEQPTTYRYVEKKDLQGRTVRTGDLLLEKSGGGEKTLVGMAVRYRGNEAAVCSNFVSVVRPREGVSSNWLNYLFFSLYSRRINYRSIKQSTGIQNLDAGSYFDERVPVPGSQTQVAIATALDRETARIDALIEKKTRFVELLKEKRQALITQAVTKGLDPTVPMKDSGVEWIGEVPAHWEVIPSYRLFSNSKERARATDELLSATQKYGVIPKSQFEELEGRQVVHVEKNLELRKHVEVDDFVISMRSFQGGLERSRAVGCVRSSYVVLKSTPRVAPEFFELALKSNMYIQGLQSTSDFIRDGQDLTFENFKQIALPLPPLAEQASIAETVLRQRDLIDRLAEKTELSVQLLRERRSALITAAVTGQIDLRKNTA